MSRTNARYPSKLISPAGGRVLPTSLFERPGLKKLTRRKHSSPRPNRQQARRDEGCPDQAQGVTSLIAMFGGGVKTNSSDKNQVRQLSASKSKKCIKSKKTGRCLQHDCEFKATRKQENTFVKDQSGRLTLGLKEVEIEMCSSLLNTQLATKLCRDVSGQNYVSGGKKTNKFLERLSEDLPCGEERPFRHQKPVSNAGFEPHGTSL